MDLFYREAGSGPAVICLHANASTSGQWRGLLDLLAADWHAIAPDSLGAGRSPPWPARADVALVDEVALLAPLLAVLPPRFHLIGHSYGAAIALKVALSHPDRVAGLVLYEPTLFALVLQQSPDPETVEGIIGAVRRAGAALDRGDVHGAGAQFIDYWMGAGAFAAMPAARQAPVAESVRNVRGWARALTTEPATLADIARLPMPISLLLGGETTASARGVARLLAATLPQLQLVELPGLGHMAPVTHPELVNPVIAAQLARMR